MTYHAIGSVDNDMLRGVIECLDDCYGEPLLFRITSDGGDPDIALAIVSLLKNYPGQVTTEIHGCCYSAAVLIFAAGAQRRISKYSWVLVHEASETIEGNATTIKLCAKQMERDETTCNNIMEQFTGTSSKVWEKMSERDTYLNADECLKLNLATEVF